MLSQPISGYPGYRTDRNDTFVLKAQLAAILNVALCAFHTELVIEVKLVLIIKKEAILCISTQFYHMSEKHAGVLVGWHCAKVKGHAELKYKKNRVKDPQF